MRGIEKLEVELSRLTLSDQGGFMDGYRDGMDHAADVLYQDFIHFMDELRRECELNPEIAPGVNYALQKLNEEGHRV